ncbi:hypothetical protein AB0L05_21900 [Nonomuraea pusilla]|uniref:hypothetical protein n=1 Tax=Nonomuraea pusilla TaxID=46177 RepID=UPI003328457D
MRRLPAGLGVCALAGAIVAAVPFAAPALAEGSAAASAAVAPVGVRTTWLEPGQTLKAGDWVRSASGEYALRQQEDGNLVLYKGRAALWSSDTAGNPGARLEVQNDGNVVIYSASRALWSTKTGG